MFLPEIVDAISVVASHPASHGQHKAVPRVGHGRHLRCLRESLASDVFSYHTG